MTTKKPTTEIEQKETNQGAIALGVANEKEDKQEQIRDALDTDIPIKTYLKSTHGPVFKQMLSTIGNIEDINRYLNILCSLAFDKREQPAHGFDMVIDSKFFMDKERLLDRLQKILSDDIHVFLLGLIDIDLLTHVVIKTGLSDKSEEEVREILISKITHMPREDCIRNILKYAAFHSIDIYTGTNDNVAQIIKEKLLKIDCTKLEDAKFVLAEFSENNNDMSQFKGINKAFDIYTQNPDKKLILMSALDIETLKKFNKDNAKLEFLLTKNNVRFLDLFDLKAFENFKKETGFTMDTNEFDEKLQPRPIQTFDPRILETLFEPDYLSTITIKMGISKPDNAIEEMKNVLKKLNLKNIQDCVFIDVCAKYKEGQYLQNMEGLDIAMEELRQSPDKKIILTTPLGYSAELKAMAKRASKEDKLDFLLGRNNVRFFEYGDNPKKLENIFEEQEETNEAILDTLNFHESGGWNPYLKDFFATLDLSALHLKNSIVVDLRPDEGKSWDDISGLHIAYETLQKYPESKIILCSLIPIEVFQNMLQGKKNENELLSLLQGKNVRLIQSSGGNSMTKEEVLKQFDGMYQDDVTSDKNDGGKTFKQLSEISSETAFQKIMESEISRFLHDAKYWIDREKQQNMIYEDQLPYYFFDYQGEKSDKRLAFEDKLIALLQMQHPSFKALPRKNNLQWVVDMYKYARAQVLPEGTRFEGVFVDWDGTLYDNKKLQFNQYIIDMIREYEKKGYKITIRTGGNLEMKQKLLDDAGLNYKIENKTDYKGGIVEIAIDNDSQEFLLANARIISENHIKV